jgi:hypothetical protein
LRIWPDGHVDPDVGVQARRCVEIIDEALRESGATLRDVVRTRVFLVDAAHGDAVARVHGEVFGRIRPATGFIVVQGFLDPRWLVEIEADAVVGSWRVIRTSGIEYLDELVVEETLALLPVSPYGGIEESTLERHHLVDGRLRLHHDRSVRDEFCAAASPVTSGARRRSSVTGRAVPARSRFAHDDCDAATSPRVAGRASASSSPCRAYAAASSSGGGIGGSPSCGITDTSAVASARGANSCATPKSTASSWPRTPRSSDPHGKWMVSDAARPRSA